MKQSFPIVLVCVLPKDNADTFRTDLLTYRFVSRLLKLPEHAVFISDIWIRTKTDSESLKYNQGMMNRQK